MAVSEEDLVNDWVRWIARKVGYGIQFVGERMWDWGMADIYREQGIAIPPTKETE